MGRHRLPDLRPGAHPGVRVDELVRLAQALTTPRPAEPKPTREDRRALRKARRAAEARGA